jgi:hypothetical protein
VGAVCCALGEDLAALVDLAMLGRPKIGSLPTVTLALSWTNAQLLPISLDAATLSRKQTLKACHRWPCGLARWFRAQNQFFPFAYVRVAPTVP